MPDDSAKPIDALESVLKAIEEIYFNWVAWPNFGDAGPEPRLAKYAYTALEPGAPQELADEHVCDGLPARPWRHGIRGAS